MNKHQMNSWRSINDTTAGSSQRERTVDTLWGIYDRALPSGLTRSELKRLARGHGITSSDSINGRICDLESAGCIVAVDVRVSEESQAKTTVYRSTGKPPPRPMPTDYVSLDRRLHRIIGNCPRGAEIVVSDLLAEALARPLDAARRRGIRVRRGETSSGLYVAIDGAATKEGPPT